MANPLDHETQANHAWFIAGIQHEIYQRIFPSLRHELVGPISVSRMAVSVLKRTLDKGDLSSDAIKQHIAKIDEQMQQGIVGIRALKIWDADYAPTEKVADIIQYGIKLMAYRLSLRKISVDYIPAVTAEITASEVQHHAFLYAWLALLCYFEDHFTQPVEIKVSHRDAHSLLIETELKDQVFSNNIDPGSTPSETPPNARPIGKQAMTALTEYCAVAIAFQENGLTLSWHA